MPQRVKHIVSSKMTRTIHGQLAHCLNAPLYLRWWGLPEISHKPLLANFALAADAPVALD